MYSSRQPDNTFVHPGNEVVQQSSHVMQLPPYKTLRKKYLNIDTRFQISDTGYGSENGGSIYQISLPQRITEVESIEVKTLELPVSFYNFSSSLKNTYFSVLNAAGTSVLSSIDISDGQYNSIANLVNAVKVALISSDLSMSITYGGDQTVEGMVSITNHSASTIQVAFDVDTNGSRDKYLLKSKLGWALGFRSNRYTLAPGASIIAESSTNLNTVRYLFLAVQENPGQGIPTSFICPISQYYINKDILARVSIDYSHFPYGNVIPATSTNGYLMSDERKYSPGKVALQNLQIQLLNEFGNPVNLNGHDFSFVIEIRHY